MQTLSTCVLSVLIVLLSAPGLSAETVEQVIEKHIAARGGHDAWNRVETMKITGDFTGFSDTGPFSMHRKRDLKYHMDHMLGKKRVIIGFDGENAWWNNAWLVAGARKIKGVDLVAESQKFFFATPFFDYAKNGYNAKLLGPTDFEGLETIAIELIRPDEAIETWYLDPASYLEVGCDSPGSDFGQALQQRVFFDDFREVGDLIIPYYWEAQWYTRSRIMETDTIEINVEIDDALFEQPLPPGMHFFRDFAGTWKVKHSQKQSAEAPWSESEYSSTITSSLRGALIEERFMTPEGTEVVRSLSFDQFSEVYRLSEISGETNHLDILEGNFDDDGTLTLSNMETGTLTKMFGLELYFRLHISDITESGFSMEREVTWDGGKNWFTPEKALYVKIETEK